MSPHRVACSSLSSLCLRVYLCMCVRAYVCARAHTCVQSGAYHLSNIQNCVLSTSFSKLLSPHSHNNPMRGVLLTPL